MTRGQDGVLPLSCNELPSSTPCRFIPAHKQSIENQRLNQEEFAFARRQAEALFQVGRTRELDVLRARRSELNSTNSLLAARESYQLALERFAIFLGLDPSDPIEVEADSPAFVPVSYDVESAIEVALANRLDLLNRRGRLEDAQRGLRLARDDLLPDLTLDASFDLGALETSSFGDQDLDQDSFSVGLTLELPVDRVNEALRAERISLVRERRGLEEFVDDLVVGIRSAFRELERRVLSLEIQRQQIAGQEKNVKIAQLRYERGELPNRDVVEAQQALLDARNALISEQVGYEIARLQLLRDLGILFIDERGMWNE